MYFLKKSPGMIPLTRRGFLLGATSLAMPAILGRRSFAQNGKEVIIGASGGTYRELLVKEIEKPFLKPAGIIPIYDEGDEAIHAAKIIAERGQAKGSLDIFQTEATACYRLANAGLLETLDDTKVPNLKYVLPHLRSEILVPQMYSLQVFIYNENLVDAPPTSLAELASSKYRGKVGVQSKAAVNIIAAASLQQTGKVTDFEAAKPLVEQLIANNLRLYPQTDAIAPALNSGEISVAVMWLARKILWRKAGLPFQASFPHEGSIVFLNAMVVPKNAPNKENAFRFLNAVLEPSAQAGFARDMSYLPTSSQTALEGEVEERLRLPQPAPKIVSLDYAYFSEMQTSINDWWNRAIR